MVTDRDDLKPQDEAPAFRAGLDITMSGAVSASASPEMANTTVDRAALRILTSLRCTPSGCSIGMITATGLET